MFQWIRVVFVACVAGLLLVACGGGGDDTAPPEGDITKRVYMMAAPAGQLVPGATEREWTLVLNQAHPQAFWFEDRPGRVGGEQDLADYLRDWDKVYDSIEPNATLHFQQGSSLEAIYARLSRPVYDAQARQLRVPVRVIANSMPATSGAVAISTPLLEVLNNAPAGAEVASWIQHAEQATITPVAGAGGSYRLTLRGTTGRTLLVQNAPGQYYESQDNASFMARWSTRFESSAPNAAVYGNTAAGKVKLYAFTLSDPQYEAATGNLSYRATALGDGGPDAALELSQVALNIDSDGLPRWPAQGKGTAYQAFGQGYDPSTANISWLYFGSDAARKQMGSLWGTQSFLHLSCQPHCRNDLQTMKDMGINLVRVYDWDQRNDHSQFLDYAHSLGIKVIVPISNYLPGQPPETWRNAILGIPDLPGFLQAGNFANKDGSDWHPAIAGVTISNEADMGGDKPPYPSVLALTAQFLEIANQKNFSKEVRVGVPVSFAHRAGAELPAWDVLDQFVAALAPYRDQLMLNPNTYNPGPYLFAPGGWMDRTFDRYGIPVLFTELGRSRVELGRDAHEAQNLLVQGQLEQGLAYQQAHPDRLLGLIHFMFDNKIWMQTAVPETDSEGAFGTFRHAAPVLNIQTVQADYFFFPGGDPKNYEKLRNNFGTLTIDKLEPTSTCEVVVKAYGGDLQRCRTTP